MNDVGVGNDDCYARVGEAFSILSVLLREGKADKKTMLMSNAGGPT